MSDKPTKLDQVWDAAFANPGTPIDIGDMVVCDLCDFDWTHSPERGGFIFESKGVCPTCAPSFLAVINRHREERLIREHCPPTQSFADFVREYRGGNNFIVVGPLAP